MINYNRLNQALKYYSMLKNYEYTEVPWLVPKKFINITLPKENKSIQFNNTDLHLIGSAEQALVYRTFLGEIQPNIARVAISPCFRDDNLDELHKQYFMKVELFKAGNVNDTDLRKIISDAYHFMMQYMHLAIIQTDIGYDIIDAKNEIELGSYGTGLAEPRFFQVMEKQ